MQIKHALFLLLLFTSCEKKQEKMERPPALVEVVKAVSKEMPYILQTIGNTEAYATVNIRPQVGGEVTGYYFKDGGYVTKGDLLYTIDKRPYEAALEEALGQFEQAKASLEFNTQKVERYKGLLPEDYVSILNYLEYVSEKEIAQGQLTQYEGAVKNAQINLEYCTINSPINGRCGKHLVDPGNIVKMNQEQHLISIKQLDPIYAYFTLAEHFFSQLQLYDRNGVSVEINIVGNKTNYRGALDFLNNTVNSSSGTVKLRAIFENKDEEIWPGQFVNVRLILYHIPNAIVIPTIAVEIDTQGPYVFVAKEDNTVEQRSVELGQQIDREQIVTSGIKAGETIVTQGQINLTTGSKYQIKEKSA